MAWRKTDFQRLSIFASLGVREGDAYIASNNCLGVLEEIYYNLLNEDRSLRTYRRSIGFGEHILKDLIPLLISVKNDTNIDDPTRIINTTVKILQLLTLPVECLLSSEQESKTDVGRHVIFELNCLLITSKEAFTDGRSTKAIMDFLKYTVENKSVFNTEECESVNNCFQLLRNILHIPEMANTNNMQNQIVWNLFTQSIDKIMIRLMSSPENMNCSVTMVQLIALMYKNQSVSNLQKLLGFWFEASLSESSVDNESNTSPLNERSGDSSLVLTSDPTSDSSDNGGSTNKKNVERNKSKSNINDAYNRVIVSAQNRDKTNIKRDNSFESDGTNEGASHNSSDSGICSKADSNSPHRTSNEIDPTHDTTTIETSISVTNKNVEDSFKNTLSDCGYVTPVENERESTSTSSNDDEKFYKKPIHHKPAPKNRNNNPKSTSTTILNKKEKSRKKLVKRVKTTIIHMKGLMHHTPTDEDISDILKEFTVDFLLKGYRNLVQNLYFEFLANINLPIDICHFFWLVTYFLKFATQLELDLQLINTVLSYDVISYLVFQGVWQMEELEICQKYTYLDLKPNLRRLHLVVTAIKEFLQTIETCKKIWHLSSEDHDYLNKLESQICEMQELKHLFLLLLREYNPGIQSKQYLQDLIVTNHCYLLLVEKKSKNANLELSIADYLKEFATAEMMRLYGLILEDFHINGKFVNNCIFTMMHHVGGDLDNTPALFQINILQTFSDIWETDYELCDDWSDLIEYVIRSFVNLSKTNQFGLNPSFVLSTSTSVINYGTPDVASLVSIENEWMPEENEYINNMDISIENINDKISNVIKNYEQTTINTNQSEMKKILETNGIESIMVPECSNARTDIKLPILDKRNSVDDDIEVLKEHLMQEQKGNHIVWLQEVLIEAFYTKLALENGKFVQYENGKFVQYENGLLQKPIAFYYTKLNLSIPLVPWTSQQSNIIKHQSFVLLLNKLGFILPGDGKVFVRIPNFWSAEHLLTIVEQLCPIANDDFKIELSAHLNNRQVESPKQMETNENNDLKIKEHFLEKIRDCRGSINRTPLPNSMDWQPSSEFATFLTSLIE